MTLSVAVTPVCRGGSDSKDRAAHVHHGDSVDARGLISSPQDKINSISTDTTSVDAIDFGSPEGNQVDSSVPRIYGTGVGVPVNITCSVDAHPQPHTFSWSLNATSQEQVLSIMGSSLHIQ